MKNPEAMSEPQHPIPAEDQRKQWEKEADRGASTAYGSASANYFAGYLAARQKAFEETIGFAGWLINAGPQRAKDLLKEYLKTKNS